MVFELNFNVTGKTVNGRTYSASSLSKQIRQMIKEKRLFITRRITNGKGIQPSNIFASVESYKYNKGKCLFETSVLAPNQKKWVNKTFNEIHPTVSIEGIGVLEGDKVKKFKLTNLFCTLDREAL
jgi:hypothetical protein